MGPASLCLLALAHGMLPPAWHVLWVAVVVILGVGAMAWGLHRNAVPEGSGWRRFVLGVGLYASGDLVWAVAEALLGPGNAVGTAAWYVSLAGLPVVVSGMRRVLAPARRGTDLEGLLDSAIITLAVALVVWQSTILPAVEQDGMLSYGVVGAIPLLIVSMGLLGLVLTRGLRGGGTPSAWLLATAIPLTALTSMVYWTVEADHAWQSAPVARVLMALSYAAASAALGHPSLLSVGSAEPVRPTSTTTRVLIVGSAVMVVPVWHAMESWQDLSPTDAVGGALGIIVTALAIGRILATLLSREAAERALRTREARFRSMAQNAYDYVILVDAQQRVIWGSDNAGGITGVGLDHMIGRSIFTEVHPDDQEVALGLFEECVARPGHGVRGSVRAVAVDGTEHWVEFSLSNQLATPAVGGVVVNYRDITETQATREALLHRATHDSLTGLPNRAQLMRTIEDAIASGQPGIGVLFLDLDRFKLVNDSLGHHAGDRLLQHVAAQLRGMVRAEDTVARIGGDEFVVLCTGPDTVAGLMDLAARLCEAFAAPLDLDGHQVTATTSIGIAVADADSTPSDLLRDADTAMYRAKDEGRNGFLMFDPRWRGESAARLRAELRLRRALDEGVGLRLHYQPVVDLTDGRMTAVEALLRWEPGLFVDRDGETPMDTGALIGLAEDSGLIGRLGEWVVQRACADLAALDRCVPGMRLDLAVNVSGAQLRREAFALTIAAALDRNDICPTRLVIELTESVLVEDVPTVRSSLQDLRGMGVTLAMDDFGTGYSALANLKRIPFGMVKIDRSFVDGVVDDPDAAAIVHAVVGMAHALGLQVVGEGVETPEQKLALTRIGCDLAQGWYVGRPMPLEALEARLLAEDRRAVQARVQTP